MTGYTRQQIYFDGDAVLERHTNAEYDKLVEAFSNDTGHRHDGTETEGGLVPVISDYDNDTRIEVEESFDSDQISMYVQDVEKLKITEEGVFIANPPVGPAPIEIYEYIESRIPAIPPSVSGGKEVIILADIPDGHTLYVEDLVNKFVVVSHRAALPITLNIEYSGSPFPETDPTNVLGLSLGPAGSKDWEFSLMVAGFRGVVLNSTTGFLTKSIPYTDPAVSFTTLPAGNVAHFKFVGLIQEEPGQPSIPLTLTWGDYSPISGGDTPGV
jgi:hypothetical protein